MIGGGKGFVARGMTRPKRIEPRVQFQPALMRLAHGELQRIPERIRRLPLRTGEIFRPRLELGGVERVARRAHLEDDDVQFERGALVEDGEQLRLLLRGGERFLRGPVDVVDRRDPRAAELARNRRRFGSGRRVTGCGPRAREHQHC